MSLSSCAALVARGDPDRFRATLAAPVAARGDLFTLYAFNLEIARAPWVTKEAMIAEMRLQWWRDVVAEPAPRAHEVAGPLHALIQARRLPLPVIDALIAARLWDIYPEPFADDAALRRYIDATAGGLMWLCALALGAPPAAEPVVRAFAFGAGLAAYLRAVPDLEARGRRPLIDGRRPAVRALAETGLEAIARARGSRRILGPAWPAMLAGWQATPRLALIVADPGIVAGNAMALSEFTLRRRLLWQSLTGRW